MNGRIYDSRLGRFLQADVIIDGANNTQGYNRYSYGKNNPLNGTDPSGYGFFKEFFDDFLGATESPITNSIVQIGLYVGCNAVSGAGSACLTAYNAAFASTQTYEYGGSLGDALTNGIIAGVSSYAFTQLAPGLEWYEAGLAGGLIGGVTAELQGGKFGHGFASAGISSAFGYSGLFDGNAGGQFLASIVVGGTASKISGGKFANGAATSAMWFIVGNFSNKNEKLEVDAAGDNQFSIETLENLPSDVHGVFKEGLEKAKALGIDVSKVGTTGLQAVCRDPCTSFSFKDGLSVSEALYMLRGDKSLGAINGIHKNGISTIYASSTRGGAVINPISGSAIIATGAENVLSVIAHEVTGHGVLGLDDQIHASQLRSIEYKAITDSRR